MRLPGELRMSTAAGREKQSVTSTPCPRLRLCAGIIEVKYYNNDKDEGGASGQVRSVIPLLSRIQPPLHIFFPFHVPHSPPPSLPLARRAPYQELQIGSYVRVFGHLRAFSGRKMVVALSIRPVTDMNEITFHFLEVIYVRERLKGKGALTGVSPSGAPKAAPYNTPAASAGGYGAGQYGARPRSKSREERICRLSEHITQAEQSVL